MSKRNGGHLDLIVEGSINPKIAGVKRSDSITSRLVPPNQNLWIKRRAYSVSQFNDDFIPILTKSEKFSKLKFDCSGKAWMGRCRRLLPITSWLSEYDYKHNLLADIIVGITIAIFQVPQSMGYCLIAHVPPVYGLYSSFFPALFYTILGTGMHCAFGPFAIVSGVMTGDIVIQVMNQLGKPEDDTPIGVHPTATSSMVTETFDSIMTTVPTATTFIPSDAFPDLKNIEIAIMVAIIIGAYIFIFGVFQLGFISSFMSEELISGFTTSASFIVFFSQVRYLLGVDLSHFSGPGNLILGIKEVFERLGEVNMTTVIISIICLTILLIFKLVVNRFTVRYYKTPFPIELFVVIGGTMVSNYMNLKDAPFNVVIVNTIGNKFPAPIVPRYELLPIMWDKCIATAIVGYTITLSVCKIYGKKHGYKPDANQEMIAMGATNVISAFFQCLPSAASLPRSALQDTAGGKTQVVSIVNCLCIVVVILALGKYLEELPVCVLGSCIAVALVSLITNIGEFKRFWSFWRVSRLDGMIWMITFWSVILISVDIGLYIGLVCSLLLLIYKSERPKIYLLGTMSGLDIYVPLNKFGKVVEPEGFKIFQMCGPLNFSNVEYFNNELEEKCGIDVTSIQKFMQSEDYKRSLTRIDRNNDNTNYESFPLLTPLTLAESLPKYLIIDCSMFSFIDYSGISTLKKIIQSYEEFGIKVVLSGIQVHLESMLAKEGFFEDISTEYCYKSVHDAVVSLKEADDINDHNSLNDNTRNVNPVPTCPLPLIIIDSN